MGDVLIKKTKYHKCRNFWFENAYTFSSGLKSPLKRIRDDSHKQKDRKGSANEDDPLVGNLSKPSWVSRTMVTTNTLKLYRIRFKYLPIGNSLLVGYYVTRHILDFHFKKFQTECETVYSHKTEL